MPKTKPKNTPSKLMAITIRNCKCVTEAHIEMNGESHEIRGNTGMGKSTILEAIAGVVEGFDPSMIRRGADELVVEVKLDDATIRRILHSDGDTIVKATDGEGVRIKAKDLVKAFSSSAFRPLEWATLGGGPARGKTERLREQRDTLFAAVPMTITPEDVTDAIDDLEDEQIAEIWTSMGGLEMNYDGHALLVCDMAKERLIEDRHGVNRDWKRAKLAAEEANRPDHKPPKSTAEECRAALQEAERELMRAQEFARTQADRRKQAEQIRANLDDVPDRDTVEADLQSIEERYQDVLQQIAKLQETKESLEEKADKARATLKRIEANDAAKADLATIEERLEAEAPDVEALEEAVNEAKINLDAREQMDAYKSAVEAVETVEAQARRYDALVKLFRDTLPKKILERSDLPVPGLGVHDGMVTINEIPLHQLGTSEQIAVGVQVARRLNPDVGFILIDRAESLGEKEIETLRRIQDEEGLQLIMTYVDPMAKPGPGVTVMTEGAAL